MTTVFYLSILFTGFCLLALIFAPMVMKQAPENQRMLDVVTNSRSEAKTSSRADLLEKIMQFAQSLRGKLGMSESSKVKRRLLSAGMRKSNSADLFYAAQLTLPVLGVIAGYFCPGMFWMMALGVIGFMAPDFWLSRQINKRKKKIRRSLPDALDLLVICVEAGLGLDQALLRVGEELVISHAEIAEELTMVNLEQRAGKPRLEAWQALADRTEVDEFSQFVSMLTQTDRFGTPIIKTLSRFAEDLRMQRRQHAEEAAAKTKIKIIFPLVLCIFPCIFIVLLAPAVLSIVNGFKSMGGN